MSKTSSKRCKSSSLVVLMLFLSLAVCVFFIFKNSGYKRLMDGLSYHQKAFPNLVNNYELIISFSLVPIETYFVPPNTWFRVYSGSLLIICRLRTRKPQKPACIMILACMCVIFESYLWHFFFKFLCYDQIFYQYLLGGINIVAVFFINAVMFILLVRYLSWWAANH